MLKALIDAFTKADLSALKAKLLHSSSWTQHNSKVYGEDKLGQVVLNWLNLVGTCSVKKHSVVRQNEDEVVHLVLQPQDSEKTVQYVFWLETNGKVIKSVHAIVDTLQLASITGLEDEEILQALPTPDPFVLPDYDQQDHLQEDLAKPSNIAHLSGNMAELLDTWWSIWSAAQLSSIPQIYAENATVSLAAANDSSLQKLFDSILIIYGRLTRVFCQIEKVAVENNRVAIKWFLDGDKDTQRRRLPFITLLSLENNKVVSDYTLSDTLAYRKRFKASQLF